MVKVTRLLEKLGLIHEEGGGEATAPAAAATTATVAAEPPPTTAPADDDLQAVVSRLAPPRPRPQLDAAIGAVAEAATEGGFLTEFPLDKVYASAGIATPEHGFTVETLLGMLEADELKDLDHDTRAKVILGMLRRLPSGPVSLDDIVADAVQRDQALDAFERFLVDRTATAERELEEANRALQAEIDDLTARNNAQIEANRHKIEAERARLEAWREGKRREEDRLAAAIAPFVPANPITREA